MISQRRSPILEKLLSTGNYPGTSIATNFEQNPEGIYQPAEFSCQFPRMNLETSYSKELIDETFARETISARNLGVPYFIDFAKDNLTQASDIWTQSSIGQNGLHYFNPSVVWYTEDDHPISSLPAETSVSGVPSFLLRVQEPQPVLTDVYNPIDTNLQIENNPIPLENPSNTPRQPFYNPTSNRLRHLTLPFTHLPCERDNFFPDLPSELTNQLFHYDFPYSNQTEESNTIPTPCYDKKLTLPQIADNYSQPQMQVSGDIVDIPIQTLPNFYPLNFVPPSFFNQYLVETQTNSQMYNEIPPANQPQQTSNYLYEFNDNNLRHLSHIRANTCENRLPLTSVDSDTIPRNLEISENSMYARISGTKPLSHQPLNFNVKEPRRKTSCIYERDVETFVPKFYEKLKVETVQTKTEQRPLCLVKEASLSEQVKTQVDEFMKSRNTRRNTGLRNWSCPICERQLARASTLKIHLRQHSGDRPFKCHLCPKSFAQKSLLKSHRRTHNGDRPFSCSHCHKTFVHSSALKTHTRTHTGERPHQCPVPNCGMAFSDSSTLSKHARVHSGERPYLCNICGRRFSQSGNLHKHRRTVHKVTNGLMVKIPENTKILSEILGNDENTTCATTSI